MAKYTQAQLTALYKMRTSGVLESEIHGMRTRFRSLAELDKVIADVESDLGVTAQPAVRLLSMSRG